MGSARGPAKVHLVTLERHGASSSYRIYTEKNRIALEAAQRGTVQVDWLPGAAEARFGGVVRPTLAHFFRSFPHDGEFRHAIEPNTAYRNVQVVTIHDLYPFIQPGLMYRAFQSVTRSAARRARLIVTQVETIHRDIGRILGPEAFAKTRIVPPPFPIPPVGRLEPAIDVLWIGNTDPRKHAEKFLRGIAETPGPRLRVTFVCHGASPQSPGALGAAYEAARSRHAVDWVTAHFDDAALERMYRSALVLVSTSSLEGYHNPPMESWARGTQVVLPDIPLYREIYEEVAGVTYYRPEAGFAAELRAALSLGPHARDARLLESVSFPAVGRRLWDIYAELAP